jgi:hypothetical protein
MAVLLLRPRPPPRRGLLLRCHWLSLCLLLAAVLHGCCFS